MSTTARENFTCYQLSQSNSYSSFNGCSPEFDKSLCWYNVTYGEIGYRICPFTFCKAVPGCENIAETYRVTKMCHGNGTWGATVYDKCIDILQHHKQCIAGFCKQCPDNNIREITMNVSLILSTVSIAGLLIALILFNIFDSIQCRRLSIHKNLAVAFIMRFTMYSIWTIANSNNVFRDCSHFNPLHRLELDWLCKMMLWLVIYFQVASVIWMLIEGLYLYSRFTVLAMRSFEPSYKWILLLGWGIPFIAVLTWSIVHAQYSKMNPKSYCWLPYAKGNHLWIIGGTMSFALLANVLLLLLIVIILVQKLRSENTAESAKIWKTIKATLLLVPLLGVSNILLFYEPDQQDGPYMLYSAILQNSQGIFISILYCFLNSEIQHAVKRQLNKFSFRCFKRENFGTERTYVPDISMATRRLGTPMEELSTSKDKSNRTNSLSPSHNSQMIPNNISDDSLEKNDGISSDGIKKNNVTKRNLNDKNF
uniref:G-protein coupled receptors family 2 profile 2 domain-containing protein n=1 Tax=Strongyloides stercoralis TaxID=6248 RepID=A0AAF5DT51_STRER